LCRLRWRSAGTIASWNEQRRGEREQEEPSCVRHSGSICARADLTQDTTRLPRYGSFGVEGHFQVHNKKAAISRGLSKYKLWIYSRTPSMNAFSLREREG
jgi:lipocalin